MKNKLRKEIIYLLCGVMGIIICVLFWKQFFITRPVIANPESAEITQITYVYDTQCGGHINLTEYNETKILDCLSNSFETRTWHRSRSTVAYKDFTLMLIVFDDYGLKQILLGAGDNYSNTGYGSFQYEIEDAAIVLKKLKNLLELEQ